RRRHTRFSRDWSSDVCSSDLGLRQPFGMHWQDGWFYVANTDGVVRHRYRPGEPAITTPGETVITLPAGAPNNHWTRNLLPSPDRSEERRVGTEGRTRRPAEHS